MDSNDPKTQEQERRFRELLGVSRDELRSRGIDPDEYLRQNVKKALEKRDWKWQGVISENTSLTIKSGRWGMLGYLLLFIGLGLLALSKISSLHVVALALAAVDLAVAVGVEVKFIGSRREYYAACKRDGVEPVKIGLLQSYSKQRARAIENAAVKPTSSVTPPNQGIPAKWAPKVEVRARLPAWYLDPTGRYVRRYWDGTSWTAWVIDQQGAEIPDPEGAPTLPAP